MLEREYAPAPCRVIYTHGEGFTSEAQDHHRAIPLVRDLPPEKPAPVAAKGAFRRPEPPRRERPAVDAQPTRVTRRLGYAGRRVEILALHAEGRNPKEIAAAVQRSATAVYTALRKAGVSLPRSPKKPDKPKPAALDIELITARRISGESPRVIALAVGSTKKRVRTALINAAKTNPQLAEAMKADADRVAGRGWKCKVGHAMTPENTGIRGGGRGRYCRTCWRAREARNAKAKRARKKAQPLPASGVQ